MTLPELRAEAAKLTPPPGSPALKIADGTLMYLAKPSGPNVWFSIWEDLRLLTAHELYIALCVGAHGWRKRQDEAVEWTDVAAARGHWHTWRRLADAAYELLKQEG